MVRHCQCSLLIALLIGEIEMYCMCSRDEGNFRKFSLLVDVQHFSWTETIESSVVSIEQWLAIVSIEHHHKYVHPGTWP